MFTHATILASSLGRIVHPFYVACAWLLAFFYSLVPNYVVAIALLTIAVMIVVFPITRRGTRSMMKMQILSPEMKSLQAKYKAKPGMSTAERQELRQKLNEEMMALYKENGVSPTGGCLPMFMQFPIFIVLYDTIHGLTHEVTKHGHTIVQPDYISHTSKLYESIVAHHGQLPALGINLADSVRTAGLSWPSRIPYIAMILAAIALQYVQMKQLSGRNPAAAQANPQMQQMQKVMPIIFAVIYISIPAGVNVYFIVSSLFRISQQEFMYRRDPQLRASLEKLRERSKHDPKLAAARAAAGQRPEKGLLGRFLPAGLLPAAEQTGSGGQPGGKQSGGKPGSARPSSGGARSGGGKPGGSGTSTGASPQRRPSPPPVKGGRPGGNGAAARSRKPAAASNGSAPAAPRPQPRAQGKRARRPR